MEKGTLLIVQAKSGKLIARVSFDKSDGKSQGIVDIQFWSPTKEDLKYDNTPCEFVRDKGLPISLTERRMQLPKGAWTVLLDSKSARPIGVVQIDSF
mgnify:CR=1 FL=1